MRELNYHMATYEWEWAREQMRGMELSGMAYVGRVDEQINQYLEKRRREGATIERGDLKFAQSADGNGWIIYDEVPEGTLGPEGWVPEVITELPRKPMAGEKWAREQMAKQVNELKNQVTEEAALAKDYEQRLRSDDYVTGSATTYSEAFRVCVYPTTSDKKGNPSRRVWIEVDSTSLSFSRNDARALAAALVEATEVIVDSPQKESERSPNE